ncbi:MAG: 23S rRNA (guanosine(2251)-2'-O)-methyltransferase RlmB [Clostridia bacterium]|nr:23S rRNA (guanosine(2251)-2'-O)-methyltransferase RlmB [Clostridia bacterium]MBQ5597653.1 23S rRNA (guanosine(2251)-2'-O)-methyltransferase RlmB [Clostridia bacterium]
MMSRIVKTDDDNIITGRNSVLELLNSNREIDRILVEKGNKTGSMSAIIAKAGQKQIPVKYVVAEKLNSICPGANHQGVIAYTAMQEYCSINDLLQYAAEKNESPFIIICDGIEDPYNLGAIIRTAECCGAHGVIIPKRRSVGINYAVSKSACGALEHMKIARVSNITAAINELKGNGVWVYGADMGGEPYDKVNFSGPVALVVGGEGKGISRIVNENCDVVLSLPMKGHITSLNASVAAGIFMYEILKFRN